MHTHNCAHGTIFHFNSDFSGDVKIVDKCGNEVALSAQDILEFVAYRYVVDNRITKLESMDYLEILQ